MGVQGMSSSSGSSLQRVVETPVVRLSWVGLIRRPGRLEAAEVAEEEDGSSGKAFRSYRDQLEEEESLLPLGY